MHDINSAWEKAIGMLFSFSAIVWAHLSSPESVLFKLVIAPLVGATVGYFVVKFWRWVFNEKS